MTNKFFMLLIGICLSQYITAQELYVNLGKNYTSYQATNPDNTPDYLLSNSNKVNIPGSSYEVGLVFNNSDPILAYGVGLTYNEYNAKYAKSGTATLYEWQTKYAGVNNQLISNLSQLIDIRAFDITAKLGINSAFLVNGYENANGIFYNLKSDTNSDYKKIILQPFAGINFSFPLSDMGNINLGYAYSFATIAKDQANSFVLINNNLHIGVTIKLQ